MTGATLLNETREFVKRFVVLPSDAHADLVALWVAHTWATDTDGKLAFAATPRLAILSRGPSSGKTQVLNLVARLSKNGETIADPTGPALASLIDTEKATVGVDEIDLLFGPGQGMRAVRTVINAGAYRGGKIARAKSTVDVFGAMALAGMHQNWLSNPALAATVSRSIAITMVPLRPGQTVAQYRERLHGMVADGIGAALASWASSHIDELATAWPAMPAGVDGRLADMWEPLLAVADVAGGEWPERARAACLAVSVTGESDDEPVLSPTARLLASLRAAFAGGAEVTTADLLGRLAAIPGGMTWPSVQSGAVELAALLRPIGVGPVRIYDTDSQRTLQGYRWEDVAPHVPEDTDTSAEREEYPGDVA